MKQYFDVAIIAPLEEEFECILEKFSLEEDLSSSSEVRFRVSLTGTPLKILIIQQSIMGRAGAEKSILNASDEFDIGLAFCVGIAGGLSSDMKIGDVCFSRAIFDVLDNTKVQDSGKSGSEISLSPTHYDAPRELIVAFLRNKLALNKSGYQAWREVAETRAKLLLPNEFTGRKGKRESVGAPKAVDGAIACGHVSASKKYNDKLKGLDRKMLAVETESGGLFSISKHRNIPAITIRGISDYADSDKNLFEEETKGVARRIAVENAITFLVFQLSTQLLISFANDLRDQRANREQPSLLVIPKEDNVAKLIVEQGKGYDERLKELAPGYHLQQQGYHLPIPRLRISDQGVGVPEGSWGEPKDILKVLQEAKVVVVSVPKEYPDYSLSWIIANELLSAELHGKQIVTAVVEGKLLRRPSVGIRQLAGAQLTSLEYSEDIHLMFVIDDFDFSSKTKVSFLIDEIKSFERASFLIVSRNRQNVLIESAFSGVLAATLARVDDVSFMEIAFFLQKQFALTPIASEVVATRLKETFREFDLSAHPSYFAGIPRDTLQRLLEANRRGELIQLAVAGYLSYIVAEESQDIKLSRSTRENFLADLAFAINVEREVFSEAKLIEYVDALKAKHDFAVSSMAFVQAFISKGILLVDNGQVRFTLPFIESYLLAKRLSNSEEDAIRYFDLDSDDLDATTFSLYAEMGAAVRLQDAVSDRINKSIAELALGQGDTHILLGSLLNPVMLNDMKRLEAINGRIREFVSDVSEGRDNREAKQKIIDASDNMRKRASAERVAVAEGHNDNGLIAKLERASRIWQVGVNLLGAGSENLEATTKRSLIRGILDLTVLIVHHWTKLNSEVDFAEIRQHCADDIEVLDALVKGGVAEDEEHAKKVAMSLADLFEFVYLSEPFRVVLDALCESAREPVLAESLANVEAAVEPQRLFHGIWLADIDANRGRAELISSIKGLPKERFIRVALTSHLLTRVFWSHWKKENRLLLLDAANEAMAIVGKKIDKNKVERMIDKEEAQSK